MGKHGNVHVEVVTDGGKIVRITVLDSRETSGLGDVAMEKLGKLIVDNQTLNVDSVSGAHPVQRRVHDGRGRRPGQGRRGLRRVGEARPRVRGRSRERARPGRRRGRGRRRRGLRGRNHGRQRRQERAAAREAGHLRRVHGAFGRRVRGPRQLGAAAGPLHRGQPREARRGHARGRRQPGRSRPGERHRQRRPGRLPVADVRGRRVVGARHAVLRRPLGGALHHPDRPHRLGDHHQAHHACLQTSPTSRCSTTCR